MQQILNASSAKKTKNTCSRMSQASLLNAVTQEAERKRLDKVKSDIVTFTQQAIDDGTLKQVAESGDRSVGVHGYTNDKDCEALKTAVADAHTQWTPANLRGFKWTSTTGVFSKCVIRVHW